jgi:hypothetical protein
MYVNVFWILMPSYVIIITWKNTPQQQHQPKSPPIIHTRYVKCLTNNDSITPIEYKIPESLH